MLDSASVLHRDSSAVKFDWDEMAFVLSFKFLAEPDGRGEERCVL